MKIEDLKAAESAATDYYKALGAVETASTASDQADEDLVVAQAKATTDKQASDDAVAAAQKTADDAKALVVIRQNTAATAMQQSIKASALIGVNITP